MAPDISPEARFFCSAFSFLSFSQPVGSTTAPAASWPPDGFCFYSLFSGVYLYISRLEDSEWLSASFPGRPNRLNTTWNICPLRSALSQGPLLPSQLWPLTWARVVSSMATGPGHAVGGHFPEGISQQHWEGPVVAIRYRVHQISSVTR